MRIFTNAEKQQLQSKIREEQERQRVLGERIQIEKEKEAKRSRGVISTVLSVKYGFLLVILGVLAFSVWPLLPFGWRIDFSGNLSLGVVLGLLFNHIAWHFTKKGRSSRVMKTIAVVWMVFVLAYMLWLLKTGAI